MYMYGYFIVRINKIQIIMLSSSQVLMVAISNNIYYVGLTG